MSRRLAPKVRAFCVALLLTACGKDILPPVQLQAVGYSLTPQGGVVPLVPGLVTLVVPESAVAAPANIVAQPVTNVPPNPLLVPGTPVAIIAPPTLVLQRPVTLVVRFASLALPTGVRASELRVSKLVPVTVHVSEHASQLADISVDSVWQIVPGSSVNTDSQTVAAGTRALGVFALMGAPVASVTVAPQSPSVTVGSTVQLAAAPKDSSGGALPNRHVSWVSSAPAVARVDSATGLVTGVAVGTDTITASSEGIKGTARVTVTPASAAPWFEKTYSSYASTAAFRADALQFYLPEDQFIDTVVTGLPAELSGITKLARLDYVGAMGDAQVDHVLALPSAVSEVWTEVWLKFSPNFTTLHSFAIISNSVANPTVVYAPGSHVKNGSPIFITGVSGSVPDINNSYFATAIDADHFSVPVNVTVGGTGGAEFNLPDFKGIFHTFNRDGYGRFGLSIGGVGGALAFMPASPPAYYDWSANFGDATKVWNGNWYRFRLHLAVGTIGGNNTKNFVRVNAVDGSLIASSDRTTNLTGAISGYSDYPLPLMSCVLLFGNIDPGYIPATMSIWIARVRAYNTDPGWGF